PCAAIARVMGDDRSAVRSRHANRVQARPRVTGRTPQRPLLDRHRTQVPGRGASMGLTAFIHIRRADPTRRPLTGPTKDWRELYEPSSDETLRAQGGRCMDCGVPFCQGDTGCPVQNAIPEWNALVRADRWREA